MNMPSRLRTGLSLAAVALLLLTSPARAVLITGDPNLPPAGQYVSPNEFHTYLAAGIKIDNPSHIPLTGTSVRTPQGSNELEQFDSSFTGDLLTLSNVPLGQVTMTGPTSILTLNKIGNTTGTFQTEMLSMNLTGLTPLGPVMVRESPTLQTLGQTTITDIGGGLFRIDSFFDVFTELSIDGGQTWMPSEGPTHMTLESVPDPGSTLALLGLALGGISALRRRFGV